MFSFMLTMWLGITTILCLLPSHELSFLIPYQEDIKLICSMKYPDRNLTFLHFPIEGSIFFFFVITAFSNWIIIDGDIAEDVPVTNIIDDLTKRIENGEKIFIHCFGGMYNFVDFILFMFNEHKGRGRTCTIGTILLGNTNNFRYQIIYTDCNKKREAVYIRWRRSNPTGKFIF